MNYFKVARYVGISVVILSVLFFCIAKYLTDEQFENFMQLFQSIPMIGEIFK